MTPRKSVCAAARENYLEMAGRGKALALAPEVAKRVPRKVDVEGAERMAMPNESEVTPTPDPSPLLADARGGGEYSEQAGRQKQASGGGEDLMARVRALYEASAVPVAEIARLVGVTERTLYKYVARGKWRRRYIVKPRGVAAAAANRGPHWRQAKGQESVKGSGGRFIARADRGRPVARGLQALDRRARARANAACAEAAALEARARADSEAYRLLGLRTKALLDVTTALEAQIKFREERQARRQRCRLSPEADAVDERLERIHALRLQIASERLQSLQRQAAATVFAPSGLVSARPMRE